MSEVVIKTQNICKRFNSHTALQDLSITVKSGSIFGLLGSNGAGKTTTVRILNGIISPTSGSATVFGIDTRTQSQEIRKLCGVQSDGGLYEKLTAYDNLVIWGKLYSLDSQTIEQRINTLLMTFGLESRKSDLVGTFSKGMKQKILIARSLIHEPELLFLDEPTSGLDPLSSRDVLAHLMSYVKLHHKTIFLCSHRLDEVEELCDTVAIVNEGSLIEIGTPGEISFRVFHDHVRHSLKDIYFTLLDRPNI